MTGGKYLSALSCFFSGKKIGLKMQVGILVGLESQLTLKLVDTPVVKIALVTELHSAFTTTA